jgi:hypothetical protein
VFLSWSEARRDGQDAAFDPRSRFIGEGPWAGVESPLQAARARLLLTRARRTASGRISGTAETEATLVGATDPTLDFGDRLFRRWDTLAAHARGTLPIGLREPGALDAIVVVAPTAFGRRSFDPTSQTLAWTVTDAGGATLDLTVPFDPESRSRIEALEALSPPRRPDWRIVGRLGWRGATPTVEPLSILMPERRGTPPLHLAFAAPPEARPSSRRRTERPDPSDAEEELEEVEALGDGYLARLLLACERRLDALGESGAGSTRHVAWFAERAPEIAGAGLDALAGAARVLAAAPVEERAALVLRTRYLVWLHRQATLRVTAASGAGSAAAGPAPPP